MTQRLRPLPIRLRGYEGVFTDVAQVSKLPTAHVPYFAAQPHKPCRVSETPAACWVDAPNGTRMRKPWTKADRTENQKREACEAAGGVFTGAVLKKNRAGKLELEFLSPSQATALGTAPGPNLRLCFADGKPGALLPVTSPKQAKQLQSDFDRCVDGQRSRLKGCAAKVAGRNAPLGQTSERSRLMDRLRR